MIDKTKTAQENADALMKHYQSISNKTQAIFLVNNCLQFCKPELYTNEQLVATLFGTSKSDYILLTEIKTILEK